MNNVLDLTMNFSVHCECLPWHMKLKVKLDSIEMNLCDRNIEGERRRGNVTHEVNCPCNITSTRAVLLRCHIFIAMKSNITLNIVKRCHVNLPLPQ